MTNPFDVQLIENGKALRIVTPAGNTLTMSREQAIALAVDMVLLCDGTLVQASNSKDRVTKWNTDSVFHRAYQDKVMPEHAEIVQTVAGEPRVPLTQAEMLDAVISLLRHFSMRKHAKEALVVLNRATGTWEPRFWPAWLDPMFKTLEEIADGEATDSEEGSKGAQSGARGEGVDLRGDSPAHHGGD